MRGPVLFLALGAAVGHALAALADLQAAGLLADVARLGRPRRLLEPFGDGPRGYGPLLADARVAELDEGFDVVGLVVAALDQVEVHLPEIVAQVRRVQAAGRALARAKDARAAEEVLGLRLLERADRLAVAVSTRLRELYRREHEAAPRRPLVARDREALVRLKELLRVVRHHRRAEAARRPRDRVARQEAGLADGLAAARQEVALAGTVAAAVAARRHVRPTISWQSRVLGAAAPAALSHKQCCIFTLHAAQS